MKLKMFCFHNYTNKFTKLMVQVERSNNHNNNNSNNVETIKYFVEKGFQYLFNIHVINIRLVLVKCFLKRGNRKAYT